MNANFTKQIIEMSTTEAKAAGKFGSPEFNELQGLRAAYPNFQIVVKAPKKAKNQLKIDYNFMEVYIKGHDIIAECRYAKRQIALYLDVVEEQKEKSRINAISV